MKPYMRMVVYPVIGPPVAMLIWITMAFGKECLSGDHCWLPEMYHPVLLFGALGIAYIFGIIPAVVSALIVAILQAKWSVTSRWTIFAVGCVAAASAIVWRLPLKGFATGDFKLDRDAIVGLALVAVFAIAGGIAGLVAESVHRALFGRGQAAAGTAAG